jgi:hypothetical protein
MKTNTPTRTLLAAIAATIALPTVGLLPAMAHSAPCPYCNMAITQDTATQDNETVMKYGRKRIEYKCVYCALAEAKTEYKTGDLTILAPSEKKGSPVIIKRTGGKWSAPATAAFVSTSRVKHKVCQAQARAFTTKAAAQAYAKKNGGMVMTLAQMNAMVS